MIHRLLLLTLATGLFAVVWANDQPRNRERPRTAGAPAVTVQLANRDGGGSARRPAGTPCDVASGEIHPPAGCAAVSVFTDECFPAEFAAADGSAPAAWTAVGPARVPDGIAATAVADLARRTWLRLQTPISDRIACCVDQTAAAIQNAASAAVARASALRSRGASWADRIGESVESLLRRIERTRRAAEWETGRQRS
ncbi:MAG TPA: hypothetical protein VML55_00250 [Planctomycetaceae bacterium]|nr:hypothetical protein [Planctomycetaceae bacterium]